jgi:hypothetical protein
MMNDWMVILRIEAQRILAHSDKTQIDRNAFTLDTYPWRHAIRQPLITQHLARMSS